MAKHISRDLIEEGCAVIETLAHHDLSYMSVCVDEAVYDIGRVIDDKYLQSRAKELLELFPVFGNFKSIHSRNLWNKPQWCREVFDFMGVIDRKVSTIDKMERSLTIADVIDEFRVDARWTANTLPGHFRKFLKSKKVTETVEIEESGGYDL